MDLFNVFTDNKEITAKLISIIRNCLNITETPVTLEKLISSIGNIKGKSDYLHG